MEKITIQEIYKKKEKQKKEKNMYNTNLIKQIYSSVNIVNIIKEKTELRKRGPLLYGLCPFHKEITPSFAVNPKTQRFHCYGCGADGNVFSFIMKRDCCSFQEAVTKLAEYAKLPVPINEKDVEIERKKNRLYQINDLACAFFYQKGRKNEKVIQYLKDDRKLTDETIKKFNLGVSGAYGLELCAYLENKGCTKEEMIEAGLLGHDEERGRYYGKFWDRIIFPIYNANKKIVGFGGRVIGEGTPKYLNSPETIIFDKSHELYGLHVAKTKNKPFILCEGFLDVISMHQAGFTSAVATLGTSLTYAQAQIISKYTNTVFIAYDSDAPGIKAAVRAIPILEKMGLRVFVISAAPYKDVDELLRADDDDHSETKNRFKRAISGTAFLVKQLDKTDPEKFYREAVNFLV